VQHQAGARASPVQGIPQAHGLRRLDVHVVEPLHDERGARMFEEGIKPSEVLFITFTDAGANEMKARIAKKCETRGLHVSGDDIQAMTFNTFAYRIVKDN